MKYTKCITSYYGSWMVSGHVEIRDGKILIVKPGKPKVNNKVDEITFSGPEALKAGKKFITARPLEFFSLLNAEWSSSKMPGIDIQKDIINSSRMKIEPPDPSRVSVVSESIVTGKGFKLQWR